MKIIKKLIPFGLMAMPFVAGAISNADDLFSKVETLLGKVVTLLISVAVIILIAAIISYIRAGEDEEKRGKARNMMIYGIIGLFVMVSLWGLVSILTGTFDFGSSNDAPDTDLLPSF